MTEPAPKEVTLSGAIRGFFKGYFDFKGRTTRAGIWWIIIFEAVLTLILVRIVILLGADFTAIVNGPGRLAGINAIGFWVLEVAKFALFIPNTAITVRRVHDAGLTLRVSIVFALLTLAIGPLYDFFPSGVLRFVRFVLGVISLIIALSRTDQYQVAKKSPWRRIFRTQ